MSFIKEYIKKINNRLMKLKVGKSGDRLEYGWCAQPSSFDEALQNVCQILKISRSMVVSRYAPLAITQIENPADHFTWNSWHMGGLERKMDQ